jgi:hypothetical protein
MQSLHLAMKESVEKTLAFARKGGDRMSQRHHYVSDNPLKKLGLSPLVSVGFGSENNGPVSGFPRVSMFFFFEHVGLDLT